MSNTYEYFEKTYRSELAKAGTHFFCQSCLVHKPMEGKSADPRYCQGCYDFLIEEVRVLDIRGNKSRFGWIPRNETPATHTAPESRAKTSEEKTTLEYHIRQFLHNLTAKI